MLHIVLLLDIVQKSRRTNVLDCKLRTTECSLDEKGHDSYEEKWIKSLNSNEEIRKLCEGNNEMSQMKSISDIITALS